MTRLCAGEDPCIACVVVCFMARQPPFNKVPSLSTMNRKIALSGTFRNLESGHSNIDLPESVRPLFCGVRAVGHISVLTVSTSVALLVALSEHWRMVAWFGFPRFVWMATCPVNVTAALLMAMAMAMATAESPSSAEPWMDSSLPVDRRVRSCALYDSLISSIKVPLVFTSILTSHCSHCCAAFFTGIVC